jgi:holin-like protein
VIQTFATLLVFQTIGEGLAYAFTLPVPGPVLGMLCLFGYLGLRPRVAEQLAPTALEFLKHLSLLFIPAGVGVMVHGELLASEWLPLLVALLTSAFVSLVVTALVLKGLQK